MRAIQSVAASIKNYATYFDFVHPCPSTITGIGIIKFHSAIEVIHIFSSKLKQAAMTCQ